MIVRVDSSYHWGISRGKVEVKLPPTQRKFNFWSLLNGTKHFLVNLFDLSWRTEQKFDYASFYGWVIPSKFSVSHWFSSYLVIFWNLLVKKYNYHAETIPLSIKNTGDVKFVAIKLGSSFSSFISNNVSRKLVFLDFSSNQVELLRML